jgi:hypothetical protein
VHGDAVSMRDESGGSCLPPIVLAKMDDAGRRLRRRPLWVFPCRQISVSLIEIFDRYFDPSR